MTTLGVLLIAGTYIALLLLCVALGKAAAIGDEQIRERFDTDRPDERWPL